MFEVVCNDVTYYHDDKCYSCCSDKLVIQEVHCKVGSSWEISSVNTLCLECKAKKIQTYNSAFFDDSSERISVFVRDDTNRM